MKRLPGAMLVLACVVGAAPEASQAFGTKRTHEELVNDAFARASANGAFDRYIENVLGVQHGTAPRLALQIALTPDLDPELATTRVGEGAYGEGRFEGRLNRSLSAVDVDEVGKITAFPFAPAETYFEVPGNCRSASDFEACYRDLPRVDIRQLLRIGTYAEDNPNPRSKHHFHDPEREHGPPLGNHGLDNKRWYLLGVDAVLADAGSVARGGSLARFFVSLVLSPVRGVVNALDLDIGNFDLDGRSAVDRALDTERGGSRPSERSPENRFALPDAERYLHQALVAERKDEREHFLALHFLAVGHVLHLLQDMGSVAHVRNDFIRDHVVVDELPGGTSLESTGDRTPVFNSVLAEITRAGLFDSAPRRFLAEHGAGEVDPSEYASTQPALDPTGFDVVDFWDRGSFDVADDSDPAHSGLAERVHNRFFSAGSASDSALLDGYARPLAPSCTELGGEIGSGADRVRVVNLPERKLASFERNGTERGRFVSSSLVPHLARCRFDAHFVPLTQPYTVVDASVQRDYLELLFPLVIDYTAKFMQFYLAPRIEVIPIDTSHFRLVNLTSLEFRANFDAVQVAYDGEDGERHVVPASCAGGIEIVLPGRVGGAARGIPGAATCTLPGPEALPVPARSQNDFWVVIRGKLGQRGAVAHPPAFDAGSQEYVVAFQHVQPTILYQGVTDLGVEPPTDASRRHDVYTVPIDLAESLPPGSAGPIATNLTNPIRERLKEERDLTDQAAAELDFGVPSSEPDGPRVALLADVDGTPGDVAFIPAAFFPHEPWILDLSLSPDDPRAFQTIPLGTRLLSPRLGRGIAWDRDATRKTIHYRTRDDAASREFFARYRADTGSITEVEDPPSNLFGIEAASHDRLVSVVQNGATTDLFLVDAETGQITHAFDMRAGERRLVACSSLTVCPAPDDDTQSSAAFSADGTRVAFLSRPGLSDFGTLFVANITDGAGNVTEGAPLTPLLDAAGHPLDGVSDPAWSPDGRWIAFVRADGNIWAVPSVGGDPIRLTGDGASRRYLEWRGSALQLGSSP